MTKKEFKKKCKEEKKDCYKLMVAGEIISSIALVIVFVAIFLITDPSMQLICSVAGGIIAVIGIILDIVGEVLLAKEFKAYK